MNPAPWKGHRPPGRHHRDGWHARLQVALRDVTRRPGQPVGRVDRTVIGTDTVDVVAEPPDRAGPPDPLGQHRGGHVRSVGEQLTHPRLERRERRRCRSSLVLRRAVEVTALMTVVLDTPTLLAIAAFGTPSAASLLINAQSSTVITLQSSAECSLFERRHCLVFNRRRHAMPSSCGFRGAAGR